jgi:DNA-binding transcriptional MerR regulator
MKKTNMARFSISKVVRETGISADTLRAWESRYGLPNPERTPSGHRLYSAKDIQIVNWLVSQGREGIRLQQAAQLYKQLVARGEDPISDPVPSPSAVAMNKERQSQLRSDWIAAVQAFDFINSETVLTAAFSQFAPTTVLIALISEGLNEIGLAWQAGEVTVAQEHFAANATVQKINQLIAALPEPRLDQRILIACPSAEEHYLPALITSYLMKQAGWNAVYLGPNLPGGDIPRLVTAAQIDYAILVGTQLATAGELAKMIDDLLTRGVPSFYGGRVFVINELLRDFMPGIYLGDSLEQLPQRFAQLIHESAPPARKPRNESLASLSALISKNQEQLAAQLLQSLEDKGIDLRPHLIDAAHSLMPALSVAAQFGELALLDSELNWLGDFSSKGEPKSKVAKAMLSSLKQAVSVLGPAAAPLDAYLGQWNN